MLKKERKKRQAKQQQQIRKYHPYFPLIGEETKTQRGQSTFLASSQRSGTRGNAGLEIGKWPFNRRVKVVPAERTSKFLKHFIVDGNNYHA